ncbi:hypothetical protein LOK49_LG10G00757 [Camellia lanceoleosa]|uniref:Uncharacterized protein n=1 Tax=Camellia lanceoleosa TaxID=1840588 RepID=A0ACC0GDA0_9ERIC|nr:hypothetical protein LOK49_LG10G00757 [Camellia lanceoleosa]
MAASVTCFAGITSSVNAALNDEVSLVKFVACRAFGVITCFPQVAQSAEILGKFIHAADINTRDPLALVRITVSWALANICDSLHHCINVVTSKRCSVDLKVASHLIVLLIECSLRLTKDGDKFSDLFWIIILTVMIMQIDDHCFLHFLFWCFYLATSYSLARKRKKAYALYYHVHSLANDALNKLKSLTTADQEFDRSELLDSFLEKNLTLSLGNLKKITKLGSCVYEPERTRRRELDIDYRNSCCWNWDYSNPIVLHHKETGTE